MSGAIHHIRATMGPWDYPPSTLCSPEAGYIRSSPDPAAGGTWPALLLPAGSVPVLPACLRQTLPRPAHKRPFLPETLPVRSHTLPLHCPVPSAWNSRLPSHRQSGSCRPLSSPGHRLTAARHRQWHWLHRLASGQILLFLSRVHPWLCQVRHWHHPATAVFVSCPGLR